MRPFNYRRAEDATTLVQILSTENEAAGAPTAAEAQFIAGGTTILDLMKLDVMRPSALIDINGVRGWDRVDETPDGLRLGALARMADVARHALVKGKYPVIAESLALAASAQLRNMATLGGNVLQRTRCTYFRDISWAACNKRNPGSGCAAIGGFNRAHAVLGVSPSCIATYPGDFAQALIALDATVETWRGGERRTFPFAELHRPPGDRPDLETTLAPDELILAFRAPAGDWTRRSRFLKIRDRKVYEFLPRPSAARTIDAEYATPTQHHNPMELFATTCVWDDDKLTVLEPSQFVYGLKYGVAEQLGIDPKTCMWSAHSSAAPSGRRARSPSAPR